MCRSLWAIRPKPQKEDSSVVRFAEEFAPVLQDASKQLVAQNWKYDHKVMRGAGVKIGCQVFDTMLAHYVLAA